MTAKAIDFKAPVPVARRRLADLPGRVIEGDPRHETRARFENTAGDFSVGTWTSTPGRWYAFSDRDEFCFIVSGHVRLIAEDGSAQDFRSGDAFLIPNGFRGEWEVVRTTTKHYAIREYPRQED
jgi:uncharacterized cupin superfamily protein